MLAGRIFEHLLVREVLLERPGVAPGTTADVETRPR
jgi:hypothetical protein